MRAHGDGREVVVEVRLPQLLSQGIHVHASAPVRSIILYASAIRSNPLMALCSCQTAWVACCSSGVVRGQYGNID